MVQTRSESQWFPIFLNDFKTLSRHRKSHSKHHKSYQEILKCESWADVQGVLEKGKGLQMAEFAGSIRLMRITAEKKEKEKRWFPEFIKLCQESLTYNDETHLDHEALVCLVNLCDTWEEVKRYLDDYGETYFTDEMYILKEAALNNKKPSYEEPPWSEEV